SGLAPESILRVADLELNLLTRDVTRDGQKIDLTQRQFELLACLVRHSGAVVSREMIAREVWEEATATWTNVIEVQVNHLRRKIERPGWSPLLHTIRGEGYLLGARS
ncbi:MAG: copR 1, partial [Planctomycetaceae bacterium]|nr:copR 1 [Planctomycetaceae bacterium]